MLEHLCHIASYTQSIMLAHILGKLFRDMVNENVRGKRFFNIYLLHKKKKQTTMKNVIDVIAAWGMIALIALIVMMSSCTSSRMSYHTKPAHTGDYVCFGGHCVRR